MEGWTKKKHVSDIPEAMKKQRGQKTWKISYKNQPGFKKSYILNMRFKINGFLEGRKKKFSPWYPKQNKNRG